MGDVVLQHFSHEHPLVLITYELKKDAKYVCYGCQQPIITNTGSPALFYYCKSYGCNYFLHKKCGELPQAVKHPKHPQHYLTLVSGPPPGCISCFCDVCGVQDWKWFTYRCSECDFDAHVSCTPLEERPKEHKFHDHPLTFTQRPSSIFCDACGTEGEDLSYRCSNTSCQFLIHDKCASSENTIKRNDHYHPLQLSYSIPYSKRKFHHNCYICEKIVHPNYWVYYCASCTYFVAHLKCGTSKEDEPLSGATSTEDLGQDLVCVPEGGLMDMMSQFSIDARIIYDENVQIRCPNCQSEPLIDDDVDRNKEMKKKEILCDVCVRPIIFPSPYSNCVKCSFVAHTICTLFKLEILQHPSHPQHPLTLSYTSRSSFKCSICDICGGFTNGYFFRCITCGDFGIDVSCATTCLPKRIKHDAHHHPLTLQNVVDSSNTVLRRSCKACAQIIHPKYGMEYVCDSSINCDYHLHTNCAMLPGTLGHDWDKHPMSLTYPPFSHPEDYFCETCEEDIHPTHWLYHCSKCDHSFHTNCALPHDMWSKFKFGITYKFEGHEHNLVTVRKPNKPFRCDNCKEYWDTNFPSLDCASCDYQICVDCGWRLDSKIIE